jgi:hypothetical protein
MIFMTAVKELKTKSKDYNASILANVPPKEAFEKIARVKEWWAKNFKGKAEKLNDQFTVRFRETFVDFGITEALPDKRIVWTVTDCNLHWLKDKKEWQNTRVVWEIIPEGKSIRVIMTHVGLVPEIECFDNCRTGWDGFIKGSLLKFLNEGKGMPE